MSRKYKGVALSWRGPHLPPLKFMILFLSEVVEAIWEWWNKKWMYYIKFKNLYKGHWLLIRKNVIKSWRNVCLKCTNRVRGPCRKSTLKVRILQFSTTFRQVYTRPKKNLFGSSLALTLKEGPVRCAKVCNKSWVILRFLKANLE